jgi:nitrate/nitrite transporter NarK
MLGLVLIAIGVISSIPLFWALPTSFLGGAAAAAGIALINCTGNLGGFVSPVLVGWLTTTTHSLNAGLYLASAVALLTGVLIIACIPARVLGRRDEAHRSI